jgi:hypothetical protein
VARRYQRLSEEICELEEQLERLVAESAPELVAVEGVGTDTAASLLIAALKTTPSGSKARRRSPTCAVRRPYRPLRARRFVTA